MTHYTSAQLAPFFDALVGRLGALPDKYKQWGPGKLGHYKATFSFITDDELKVSAARLRMSFDYQYSLYLWLQPYEIFDEHHRFVLVKIIAQVYEALLLDLIRREMSASLAQSDTITRMTLGGLISLCHEIGHVDKTLNTRLKRINEIRNMVHTTNWSKKRLDDLLKLDISSEIAELDKFASELHAKYGP